MRATAAAIRCCFGATSTDINAEPILGPTAEATCSSLQTAASLGFETRSELWTAALDGGTPQRLLPNHALRGGTWGDGGGVVFGRVRSGLWLASAAGGEPRQLTFPAKGSGTNFLRCCLAAVLCCSRSWGPPKVRPALPYFLFETGETRALFEGVGARFVGSGHVVFGRLGKLWAVGFDPAH